MSSQTEEQTVTVTIDEEALLPLIEHVRQLEAEFSRTREQFVSVSGALGRAVERVAEVEKALVKQAEINRQLTFAVNKGTEDYVSLHSVLLAVLTRLDATEGRISIDLDDVNHLRQLCDTFADA